MGDSIAQAAAPREGLIGWWTMDTNDMSSTGATLYDKSGQNNNGTVTGTTTSTGRIGQSRTFNGTSDTIIAADNASLRFGVGSFTLSAWIKTSNTNDRNIIDKYAATGGGGQYSMQISSNKLRCWTWNAAYGPVQSSNTTITDNKWHHVLCSVSSDGTTVTVYVDGAADGSNTATAKNSDSDSTFKIGSNSTPTYFTGSLDDVRIYNRALSAAEVAQLYSSAKTAYTKSAPRDEKKLVGWWTMDNNDINGTTYYDKSGLGNNATSTSASPQIAPGKINEAFQASTGLATGDINAMDSQSAITISTWIKATSTVTQAMIVSKKPLNSVFGLYFESGGLLRMRGGGFTSTYQLSYSPPINVWKHLVAILNGTTGEVYIDGVSQGQQTINAMGSSAFGLRIGRAESDDVGAGYNFPGSLDDVRIYNYALSAQEVSQLYTAAKKNYTSSAPMEGLVGWWKMDVSDMSATGATLYDKSGKNNNGTVTGTTTSTGRIAQARSFNGTSDKISISNVDMAAASSTFAIWFRANALNLVIAGKSGDADTYIYPPNSTRIDVQTDTSLTVKNFTVPTMSLGVWYHLVVTRGSNTTRLYLNGVESSSGGQTQTDAMTINQIGTYSSGSLWWNGALDDVRFYNRALSATEVSQLYNSAKKAYIR